MTVKETKSKAIPFLVYNLSEEIRQKIKMEAIQKKVRYNDIVLQIIEKYYEEKKGS